MEVKDNDPYKWLAHLAGDRYIEPKEESYALPAYLYKNPEDSIDRIRAIKRAQDRQPKGKYKGDKY